MKKFTHFILFTLLMVNIQAAPFKLSDFASIKCEAYVGKNNSVHIFLIIENKYDSDLTIRLNPIDDIVINLKDETDKDAENLCHGGSWLNGPITLKIPKGSELKWLITTTAGPHTIPTLCMPFKIWEIPRDKLAQYNFDLEVKMILGIASPATLKFKDQKIEAEPNHTLQRTSTAVTDRAAHAPRQLLRSLT